MSYYPIKCPYCLENHTNETVRFRLRDAVLISTRAMKSSPTRGSLLEQEANSANQTFGEEVEEESWDADIDDTQSASNTSQSSAVKIDEDEYFTLDELKAFEGFDNVISVKGEYREVNACQALTMDNSGNSYDGELLNAVIITRIEDRKVVVRAMYDRYCDCEDGRKFTMSSGSIPSYVVLLMGSSASGKTVCLCSLYHELSRQAGYSLPPTDDPEKSLANITLTVLGASKSIETSADANLVKMTDDL
ncbi:MAG: hypothetical protein LBH09_05470, partial [Peptococcaceae bacterium]|nr:hypothetical protein [Peptococcaceae bacterium]